MSAPTATFGLTSKQVAERVAAGQVNRPPQPGTKSTRAILLDNLVSVFNIIIGCIILFLLAFYMGTRDSRLLWDCVGVFFVAFFNTVIAFGQEIRAKRAMDKVNMLIVREVTVMRDGKAVNLPHSQIVLQDVIAVKRGDQAVVDGSVLQSNHLEIDESLLTGESEPIEKREGDSVLSGSFCLSGNGYYVVEKLSDSSYASKMTQIAQRQKAQVSPLQRSINGIVKLLFCVAIFLCVLQGGIGAYNHQLDVDFVRKIATIMIGLVPQGLVLTASVVFAIGIFRISKVGAVVQTFNAIESFAGVQVICMDKTGTLTQNRMSVRKITPFSRVDDPKPLEGVLGTYARLSSDKNATIRAMESLQGGGATVLQEYPFSSQRKMSVLTLERNGQPVSYVLGALELLSAQCAGAGSSLIEQQVSAGGLEVYRNLLFGEVADPENIKATAKGLGMFRVRPLCIVSLSDMVRPDVCDVITEFGRNGIRFKILSGDSPTSILATCRDIGWTVKAEDVITGVQLEALEAHALEEAVERCTVFARLKPEQKVIIVKALQARGLHTAMIGDGVNDVPAIKQADLGIAMDEGASITKEVADIILRNNNFTLLPQVFEEGKKIINTVGTVAKLFLTKNFLVIYLTLASALFLLDFPLTPRRVSLFNIFAIGAPAMLIAFTNSSTERQKRFFLDMLSFVALSALVIVSFGYAGFAYAKNGIAGSDGEVPKMAMVSIMVLISVVNFMLIISRRGVKGRRWYLSFALGMILVYVAAVSVTSSNLLTRFLHKFYEIVPLGAEAWRVVILAFVAGSVLLVAAQRLREALVNRGA
ncbi:MAG: HAD-IC family P-type ATPase [Bryobacteraceae bacterium]|jgi:cation-transporting ATPase E